MRATTAVILARGQGTRMRAAPPATGSTGADGAPALSAAQAAAAAGGEKGMMPLGGRPLLDHVLSALADGGVKEVVFVVAPGEPALRAHYTAHPPRRVSVHFAVQEEARGTADALLAARPALEVLGAAEFLMLNADNLYPAASVAALVNASGPGLIAYESEALVAGSNIDATRVMRFALLDLAADGTLREIVEKPGTGHPLAMAAEKWVSMNLWRFARSILDHCAAVGKSPRGELELVDAVRRAMAAGERFTAIRQRLGVLDLSSRADIGPVERALAGHAVDP